MTGSVVSVAGRLGAAARRVELAFFFLVLVAFSYSYLYYTQFSLLGVCVRDASWGELVRGPLLLWRDGQAHTALLRGAAARFRPVEGPRGRGRLTLLLRGSRCQGPRGWGRGRANSQELPFLGLGNLPETGGLSTLLSQDGCAGKGRSLRTETEVVRLCFHLRNLTCGSLAAAWTGRTGVSRAR